MFEISTKAPFEQFLFCASISTIKRIIYVYFYKIDKVNIDTYSGKSDKVFRK